MNDKIYNWYRAQGLTAAEADMMTSDVLNQIMMEDGDDFSPIAEWFHIPLEILQ